jgi:hypothetical protein
VNPAQGLLVGLILGEFIVNCLSNRHTGEMKTKLTSIAATLILVLMMSSCSGSDSGTSSSQVSETEEVTEVIAADAKLDAEWQDLVTEEPELTTKCEPFIKYRLGRNEVRSHELRLESIAFSQSVFDASGENDIDVKLSLVNQRQEAERQRGLAFYWFSPWQSEVENLIVKNKKLAKECNFTNDELIENLR